jgi:hypothetical protein
MAKKEHLRILKEGADAWNKWRKDTKLISPDLHDADLIEAKLSRANLSRANLSHSDLGRADLLGADLSHADLIGADLIQANLIGADLSHADLRRADLSEAVLRYADLSEADLGEAYLGQTELCETKLDKTSFFGAYIHRTIFAFISLKTAKGLDKCRHQGPSAIDYQTLMQSGPLPEAFLRGCGLPDEFIDYLTLQWNQPIQFYSCFISYAEPDEDFASRLHNDFQDKGIRCWKWNHDARTGRSLWGEIDKAIRVYDKLVLIASESSLKSPAVNREIERALVQEDERLKRKLAGELNVDCDVLFPVRIDEFLFHGWEHERKVDVTKKVIADARGWDKDPAVYAQVRDRLIRDLKSERPKSRP